MTPGPNEYTLQNAAKLLGMGPQRLFRLLRQQRVLNKHNLPYQRYIDQGVFRVREGTWIHPELGQQFYGRTFVTQPGMRWLERFLQQQAA